MADGTYYDSAPKAPPRIRGPIPFAHSVFPSGAAETAEVASGPIDEARIRAAILMEGSAVGDVLAPAEAGVPAAPEMTMPPPMAAMPADYAPQPEALPAPPSDPSLMGFAVPDGGPPPTNQLEASLLDGMLNGPGITPPKRRF